MTAVQIGFDEFLYWLDAPELLVDDLEQLSEEQVEQLLLRRFHANLRRGYPWRRALLMAVGCEQPA